MRPTRSQPTTLSQSLCTKRGSNPSRAATALATSTSSPAGWPSTAYW